MTDDDFDRYLRVLRATLPVGAGELKPEDRLQDLGLDSVLLIQLVVELEDEFRNSLPDSAIVPENFETVGTAWDTVQTCLTTASG